MLTRLIITVACSVLLSMCFTAARVAAAEPEALDRVRIWQDAPPSYDPRTADAWFNDTIFNLLVDYYTEVPQRPYGTGFNIDNIVAGLKQARPGFVMTYAKGHSGLTAFESRLGTEHPMLGDDPLALFGEAARKAGVKYILYYSGLIDGLAAQRNPEWAIAGRDGRRLTDAGTYRMLPICPSSRYFEDWVAVHLEEIMTRYKPDGVWVDGDWGGAGACYCQDCERLAAGRFEGGVNNPDFHLWVRNEFRGKFGALVRRFNPDAVYSSGNTTPAVDARLENHMDWYSGDWFTPSLHRILQSLSMRRYTTLGVPYDAMTCDTQYVRVIGGMRSRVKTLDRMLQEGATVLANGGKWCYWTYPMPHGALIPSRMEMAARCRVFAEERRHLWLGTESARWTAVVDAWPRPLWYHGNEPLLGAAKALMHAHRSPDLIHINQLTGPIPYGLLVVANQPALSAEQAAMLEGYVRSGGTLLTAGTVLASPGMAELAGVNVIKGAAQYEGHVLLADGTPAGIDFWWDYVEPAGAEVWWKLYRSWGHDDAGLEWLPRNYPITGMLDEEQPDDTGFPAVTAHRVGKGLVVHIPGDPFGEYWKYGHPTTRRWIAELLDRIQPDPMFETNAQSWVEAALRTRGDELLVHFVNGSGPDLSAVNTTDLYVDELPNIGPYQVSIRCPHRPESVLLEPGSMPLEFTWSDGNLRFTMPRFHIHSAVSIRPWSR